MQKALEGRTAIVTGSGRNIGAAIAKMFARNGAAVIIIGHQDKDAVVRVVEEIEAEGGRALGMMADVGDPEAMAFLVDRAREAFGGIDIAVTNVGRRRLQSFLDISLDDWHQTLNTNLNAAFYLNRLVIPGMIEKRWGRLIHISGVDGFAVHMATRAHNIVCKAGLHALAKALALEFGPYGITANTVAPGVIDTLRDESQYRADWRKHALNNIPLQRLGNTDDIAAACLYLAAESGDFISGQVIHVNGGEFRF